MAAAGAVTGSRSRSFDIKREAGGVAANKTADKKQGDNTMEKTHDNEHSIPPARTEW